MLKNDLYEIYGTANFLSQELQADIADELNVELARYLTLAHPDDPKAVKDLAEDLFLLRDETVDEFLERALAGFDKEQFLKNGSGIYPDFLWADSLLENMAGPESKKGQENAFRLKKFYQDLSNDNPQALEFIENWKPEPPALHEEIAREAKDPLEEGNLKEILQELDDLTGLESVKQEIHDLVSMLEISRLREKYNLHVPQISRHMVFTGNPGTGKTTVARILGKIYKELGLLEKGQLIETDRSGLVAGYIGQTAIQTQDKIKKALGGILFIDEAYALSKQSANDFGQEAIDTLLKAMEDNRDNLVVIAAGYPDEMERFLDSNPGLRSRFGKVIRFEDYDEKELMSILRDMTKKADYVLDAKAIQALEKHFEDIEKNPPKNFGNGRYVRNLLEKAMLHQARRLMNKTIPEATGMPDKDDLVLLKKEDFGL